MKIKRHLRQARDSGVEVSGPGMEKPKKSPSLCAGYAFALDKASRMKGKGGTFYVREYGDVVARAEGDGQGRAFLFTAA